MPFISLTRLRIRSPRLLPFFAFHALKSTRQVRHAQGLPNRRPPARSQLHLLDHDRLGQPGRHAALHDLRLPQNRHAPPRCDEASVAHWTQPEPALPTWEEADRRMRASGRASKVRNPSPHHESLTYRAPRTTGAGPIAKAKPSR